MKSCYGTAAGYKRTIPAPQQAYLPGFDTG